MWRVGYVSAFMAAGAFGTFFWALGRGLPVETARTLVVNAVVVMEIFHLFSVRYVHGRSLTMRGLMGTPVVLAGVAVTALAQLAFTYWPPLAGLFDARPVALIGGLVVIGVGVALLFMVEAEKALARRFTARSA